MIALQRQARSRKVSQKMAEAQGSAGEVSEYLRRGVALERVRFVGRRKASKRPYKPRDRSKKQSAPPVAPVARPPVLAPRLPKPRGSVGTGTWRVEEDDALRMAVALERGDGKTVSSWPDVAAFVPQRSAKQCRERWFNHVSDEVSKDPWTETEDATICGAQAVLGNKWAAIAQQLPGRTDNQVKNRWNAKLRPDAREQVPPVTCTKKRTGRQKSAVKKPRLWPKSRGEPRSLVSDFAIDATEMQEAAVEMELRYIDPSQDIAFIDDDDDDDLHGSTPQPPVPDGDDAVNTITLGEVMRGLAEPISEEQELMTDETIHTADVDVVAVLTRGVSTELCDMTRSSQAAFDEINAMLRARPDACNEAWDGLPAHIVRVEQLV